MELDHNLTHGVRGVVSCDYRMSEVLKAGGVVPSPVPGFDTIRETQAIG